jgi:hypothetical protein
MGDESRSNIPWVCTHEEWADIWCPRCPDGNHRRLLQILGFRLKGPDFLQLRVALRRGDNGVCQAIAEEYPDTIVVRALACLDEDDDRTYQRPYKEVDWPCNVLLDAPLGDRAVIDQDSGEELLLLIPGWDADEDRSRYVPRPPGPLWPPQEDRRASS